MWPRRFTKKKKRRRKKMWWSLGYFLIIIIFLGNWLQKCKSNEALTFWLPTTNHVLSLPLTRPPPHSVAPVLHTNILARPNKLVWHQCWSTCQGKNPHYDVGGLEWETLLLNSNQKGDSHASDTSVKHQPLTDMPLSVSQYNNSKQWHEEQTMRGLQSSQPVCYSNEV